MTPKNNKGVLIYAVLAFIIIISLTWAWPYIFSDSKDVKYSEIISYFDNYEVTNYTFDLGSGELVFQLKDKDEKIKYTVPNVSIFLNDTENYRQEYNKNPDSPLEQDYFKIKDNSWLLTIVPTLVLLVMAVLLFFYDASGRRRK